MIVATLATLSNSDQTPELAHDSEAIDEEARRRIEEPLINHAISGLKALTREPQSPSRPGSALAAFALRGRSKPRLEKLLCCMEVTLKG